MKRIILMLTVAAFMVAALAVSAPMALAAPQQCQPGNPGCKTTDDPNKNNPKFTVTKKGNGGGSGSFKSACNSNPSGKCR